jgi:two-component system OmpR family sensor kinase
MPKSLSAKLVAVMLALIGLVAAAFVAQSVFTTRLYLEEVSQKLNQPLARNIVESEDLIRGGAANHDALERVFHTLMAINPSIEVYLVDPAGKLLAYSAPPGTVRRQRIDLAPVQAFLAGGATFPLRGDDPRNAQGRKVFSAWPVREGGKLAGYLYVVLGGQAYESVAQMIAGSYILRTAAGVAAASLLLSLAVGLLSFTFLTRRLRRLATAVEAFKRSQFREVLALPGWRRDGRGDEIDELGVVVERMSRRIVEQLDQLRHADAARREMVANVSHDLRTPLTSLQGFLETMLIKEGDLSAEERRRYAELALKHTRRLEHLAEELLELARLESTEPELRFEPFSLAELAQDVVQKFNLEAERKGLRLDAEIPATAPFVSGDIGLIERVMENLIENAIKYTPEGGAIRLTVIPGTDRIAARISDTGPGIAAAELPRIFDRFYRVEKARGEAPAGTGLGLAIVQRILQLHGSPIEVDSRPGVGTSFTFTLPVAA